MKNDEGKKDKLCLYYDGETVAGTVRINLKGKKLEHHGIRVEFVGQIGINNYNNRIIIVSVCTYNYM